MQDTCLRIHTPSALFEKRLFRRKCRMIPGAGLQAGCRPPEEARLAASALTPSSKGQAPREKQPPSFPHTSALLLLLWMKDGRKCLSSPYASEPYPRSPNATDDVRGAIREGSHHQQQQQQAAADRESLGKHRPGGPPRNGPWPGRNASTAEASQATGAKESQLRTPAVLPDGGRGGGGGGGPAMAADGPAARGPPAAGGVSVRFFSGEMDEMKNESALCLSCPGGTGQGSPQPQKPLLGDSSDKGPMEALSVVTSFVRPVQGQDGTWQGSEAKAGPGSPPPTPEGQEEAGSGDPRAQASPKQGSFAEWTVIPPTLLTTETSSPTGRGLSSDSAETDLLLDTFEVAVPPSPTLGAPIQTLDEAGRVQDQDSAQKEEPLELWVDATSNSPAEGAQGLTDLTWLDTEAPQLGTTPPDKAMQTSKPSLDPLASEIIDIDYYDLYERESLGGAGSDSTKRKPSDEKGMSWSLHDLYDDFTPFDESDFYPTTSFYTDGDEEDLEEPEEDEEEEEGGGGLARELEDENDYRIPTPATPKIQTMVQEAESTSRRYVVPPLQTFIVSGGNGAATPRPRPAEMGRDLSLSGSGENGTECRSGYIRHNNSCKSLCDTFPSYCHNGGQCYLVENLGAFCRCNTQDYIWHKGIRCESIITDFQVMCVAVGSAALVVLLLFMMTVFFAKKLYLLKTENNKLRKTKYRTPSELHNDNFSLSTIAEGSHPNDDPSAPHKLQDPLKSCLKEEEPFNIQNSMSPKLDNGKGDPEDAEVNCLQNNLT
ncbi:chondroitin sulfate proteoglycan 5 isoform X2 [Hemicordylus capensis]|uniref:chondroitin sulfate proteoglycan 5 isoform X2 n=1 Tax=Hemicordylus capensis TaxID=884348 RepID=UPI0023037C48|nr:chondroitin sulfate proteoglycan 5 isoform X2 [Hemicordylus capensis]